MIYTATLRFNNYMGLNKPYRYLIKTCLLPHQICKTAFLTNGERMSTIEFDTSSFIKTRWIDEVVTKCINVLPGTNVFTAEPISPEVEIAVIKQRA